MKNVITFVFVRGVGGRPMTPDCSSMCEKEKYVEGSWFRGTGELQPRASRRLALQCSCLYKKVTVRDAVNR